jgi:hypothetical protein
VYSGIVHCQRIPVEMGCSRSYGSSHDKPPSPRSPTLAWMSSPSCLPWLARSRRGLLGSSVGGSASCRAAWIVSWIVTGVNCNSQLPPPPRRQTFLARAALYDFIYDISIRKNSRIGGLAKFVTLLGCIACAKYKEGENITLPLFRL